MYVVLSYYHSGRAIDVQLLGANGKQDFACSRDLTDPGEGAERALEQMLINGDDIGVLRAYDAVF